MREMRGRPDEGVSRAARVRVRSRQSSKARRTCGAYEGYPWYARRMIRVTPWQDPMSWTAQICSMPSTCLARFMIARARRLPRKNATVTASCFDNRSRGPTQICWSQSTIRFILAFIWFISIILAKSSFLKKSSSVQFSVFISCCALLGARPAFIFQAASICCRTHPWRWRNQEEREWSRQTPGE